MTRFVKTVLIATLIEMFLVAGAALAHQAGLFGGAVQPGRYGQAIVLGALPILLAVVALRVNRRFASTTLRLSDSHRRFLNESVAFAALLFAGVQGLSAYIYFRGEAIHDPMAIRLLIAACGVFFAVRGNFAAKLDPPTGPSAPPPVVWTRNMMRFAWCTALVGAVMVVSAITLSPNVLRPAFIALVVIATAAELLFRRSIRRYA
jgi:hypothetical protein